MLGDFAGEQGEMHLGWGKVLLGLGEAFPQIGLYPQALGIGVNLPFSISQADGCAAPKGKCRITAQDGQKGEFGLISGNVGRRLPLNRGAAAEGGIGEDFCNFSTANALCAP